MKYGISRKDKKATETALMRKKIAGTSLEAALEKN